MVPKAAGPFRRAVVSRLVAHCLPSLNRFFVAANEPKNVPEVCRRGGHESRSPFRTFSPSEAAAILSARCEKHGTWNSAPCATYCRLRESGCRAAGADRMTLALVIIASSMHSSSFFSAPICATRPRPGRFYLGGSRAYSLQTWPDQAKRKRHPLPPPPSHSPPSSLGRWSANVSGAARSPAFKRFDSFR